MHTALELIANAEHQRNASLYRLSNLWRLGYCQGLKSWPAQLSAATSLYAHMKDAQRDKSTENAVLQQSSLSRPSQATKGTNKKHGHDTTFNCSWLAMAHTAPNQVTQGPGGAPALHRHVIKTL